LELQRRARKHLGTEAMKEKKDRWWWMKEGYVHKEKRYHGHHTRKKKKRRYICNELRLISGTVPISMGRNWYTSKQKRHTIKHVYYYRMAILPATVNT